MDNKQCLPEELRIRVLNYEEIRRKVLALFLENVTVPRGIRKQGRERVKIFKYLLKCEKAFQFIVNELGKIARLPRIELVHPFYGELINIASQGMYNDIIDRSNRAVKIIVKLWKEYRDKILSSYTASQAKQLAQEFIGRTLSVVKRSTRNIEYVQKAIRIIRTTPCIDVELPTIIIAGMPQVGKSTLVSRISSAKPEIAPYPFTTKHIILGHLDLGITKIQIIDTPGILDRPVDEMNEIERKAVAALKHLKAIIVFLMDPSRDSYYNFDNQLKVLQSIASFVGMDKLVVVFNKVDKVSKDRLEECLHKVESLGFKVSAFISALYGLGVDDMLEYVAEKLNKLYGTDLSKYLKRWKQST